jgi:hypothetical protein
MELIKDYDRGIIYHPGKANVVAGALSRMSHVNQVVVKSIPFDLCDKVCCGTKEGSMFLTSRS